MYGLILQEKTQESQFQQIYEQLREKILNGEINSDKKMASSRSIADFLKVSRSLVMEVIDQLKVEGFLESRKGSGTYVVPDLRYQNGTQKKPLHQSLSKDPLQDPKFSFLAGIPDPGLFPRRRWNKMYQQAMEYADDTDLFYTPGQGRLDLRIAIRDYLYRVKGINVSEESIVITSGAAQAIHLLSLISKGGTVAMEDPLAPFVYDIFKAQSYEIRFAEVDNQGIDPGSITAKNLDYIYCSPSHQFPLGGSLPANRRIELLNLARSTGAYIIEDDYDGEYRYESRPIAALQVLDPFQVVYIGTFSKILSPALRLAYMVVPTSLISPILKIKRKMEFIGEGLQQAAMAKFISEGHLEKHLRSSIKYYIDRRTCLINELKNHFGDEIEINGEYTGLHLAIKFADRQFSPEIQEKAAESDLMLKPVSSYSIKTVVHRNSLVIGFGLINHEDIPTAVEALSSFISSLD
jgi:GntR family transcriptional regulator/MocR family aminotransferase